MKPRPLYAKLTGKLIPHTFHVHHIDGDRSNNEIHNLVALPIKTHGKYHHLKSEIKFTIDNYFADDYYELSGNINGCGAGRVSYDYDVKNLFINHREFAQILNECNYWIDCRDYLLGEIDPEYQGYVPKRAWIYEILE